MSAVALAWSFGVLALIFLVLLVIAVGAYDHLAAENRRLRGTHLRRVHPSTRKAAR